MKTRRTSPPTYEVEFVPLERRMTERRKSPDSCYLGPERRKAGNRRDDAAQLETARDHKTLTLVPSSVM